MGLTHDVGDWAIIKNLKKKGKNFLFPARNHLFLLDIDLVTARKLLFPHEIDLVTARKLLFPHDIDLVTGRKLLFPHDIDLVIVRKHFVPHVHDLATARKLLFFVRKVLFFVRKLIFPVGEVCVNVSVYAGFVIFYGIFLDKRRSDVTPGNDNYSVGEGTRLGV